MSALFCLGLPTPVSTYFFIGSLTAIPPTLKVCVPERNIFLVETPKGLIYCESFINHLVPGGRDEWETVKEGHMDKHW